ncbi:MAG TPA: DUF4170 domain-containing protein [Alphaproteobacteria bacterium]
MAEYWVVGGEYTDTSFTTLRSGAKLECYGPFVSYEAARKEWLGRTMQTIDNALIRYRIVSERPSSFESERRAAHPS